MFHSSKQRGSFGAPRRRNPVPPHVYTVDLVDSGRIFQAQSPLPNRPSQNWFSTISLLIYVLLYGVFYWVGSSLEEWVNSSLIYREGPHCLPVRPFLDLRWFTGFLPSQFARSSTRSACGRRSLCHRAVLEKKERTRDGVKRVEGGGERV